MKKFWALFFIMLICILLVLALQKPRPVDEGVMIENAILYHLEQQHSEAFREDQNGDWQTIHYKIFETKEEYLNYFPECCRFSLTGTEGDRPSFLDRWRYNFAGVVILDGGRRRISVSGEEIDLFVSPHEIHMNTDAEVIPHLPRR